MNRFTSGGLFLGTTLPVPIALTAFAVPRIAL